MAAAGNPTISTFLELRDNMSAGVKSVSSEIDKLRDAAKAAEDAIIRMKHAQAMRLPRPPPPPKPPRMPGAPGTPGGPPGGELFKFTGGIFNAVTRANLLVDAIENAVVGATRAVTGLLKYTVKVGEEYENTQLSITNTLVSMSLSPSMRTGQERSLDLMSKMRILAAKLPGEAKDYIEAFSLTLPDAIASGQTDIVKYADFISRYMATAISKGVDAPQAGRDLVEMLQGVATRRTKTFQKLRTEVGMLATDFNKLTPSARFQKVFDAVGKAGQGLSLAADTANAKFGELKTRIEEIFAIGGKPFFEGIKTAASDLNDLLARNNTAIMRIATTISTELGYAIRGLSGDFSELSDKAIGFVDRFLQMREAGKMLQGKSYAGDPLGATYEYYVRQGQERVKQEKELARIKEEQEQAAVLKKYPQLEGRMPPAPGPIAPLEFAEYRRMLESSIKSLWSPPQGMQRVFESSEEWAAFAKSKGFENKEIQRMWDEMVQEGKISLPTAPLKTRELKVEFNNNRFDIRQEFAEGFDPDRIAVAFASDLARAGEMKLGAVTAPTFSTH